MLTDIELANSVASIARDLALLAWYSYWSGKTYCFADMGPGCSSCEHFGFCSTHDHLVKQAAALEKEAHYPEVLFK